MVKRRWIFCILIVALTLIPITVLASPTIIVDGKIIYSDTKPMLIDGRVFVPLRSIMDALNIEVQYPAIYDWNDPTDTSKGYFWRRDSIGLTKGLESIVLFIGEKKVWRIGKYQWQDFNLFRDRLETFIIDAPPIINNNRTLVPLRFVAQSFGYSVVWDSSTQSVFITPSKEDTVKNVISQQSHTVVTIYTDKSQGTGYFTKLINNTAYVLTNYHVIEDAADIIVKTKDGKQYSATLSSFNYYADLAELKFFIGNDIIKIARSASSNQVNVGDEIIVIGSPMGLDQTVSTGIVSAIRNVQGMTVFQITAPISPGSSGSPVFNKIGEVIGVATATIIDGQNLNIAIPPGYIIHGEIIYP